MGLVQRALEAAGFSTITISPMWEVTAAFGVPRLAAVEHPFSQTMGQPGDAAGQRAVLRAALEALAAAKAPGEVAQLPFVWPERRAQAIRNSHARPAPPITGYIKKRPWLMAKFLRGQVPKPG